MKHSIAVSVFAVGFISAVLTASQNQQTRSVPTERVTGIGGVFFKAKDLKALPFSAAAVVWPQAAQTRREPQFENEHVRAWKSIILPNQPLALHRHEHGRTIVALKGGTLDVVDARGATVKQMTWETGKAYWLDADPPGQQHGDLNRGTDSIEVIVVELRK